MSFEECKDLDDFLDTHCLRIDWEIFEVIEVEGGYRGKQIEHN